MEGADFEWDDTKAAHNLASHGVSFEAAQLAFDDPFAVVREDRRQDYGAISCSAWSKTTSLSSSTHSAARGLDHLSPIGGTTGTTTLP